ncbi:2-phosphoxylose phosphatase 1 [Smittium culicis]|uniref:2-phosphoxylose phosphatase 1 n=2 Tax=Smittium culicis TaxID=133412 RepID=A0A1R1YGW3_9FUNG|nr:2-phosphoxylose phosphatase 1 [Smittium culicis]
MKVSISLIFLSLFTKSSVSSAFGISNSNLSKKDLQSEISKYGYTYCKANTPNSEKYSPMEDSELQFVQVLMRHGGRAPIYINESDKSLWNVCDKQGYESIARPVYIVDNSNSTLNFDYVVSNTSACLPGELTKMGAKTSMDFGTDIRKIYINKLKFLNNDIKDQSQLRVRTTFIDRTMETARYFLSGLYPINESNKNVKITEFHYPYQTEVMFTNSGLCSKMNPLLDQIISTPQYKSFLAKDPEATQKINLMSDNYSPNSTDYSTSRVYQNDILQARVCENIKLPCNKLGQCATQSDADLQLSNVHYEVKFKRRDSVYSHDYERYAAGPLLGQLLSELNSVISTKNKCNQKKLNSKLRMSIYSGHDDTMSNFVAGLMADDFGMLWPSYNANAIIELWKSKSNGKYKIRIIYNGQILKVLSADGGPKSWCDFNGCDFDSYTKYINAMTPNLTSECSK